MNWVIVIWSMTASACLTLAAIYVIVWYNRRQVWANLLFVLMALATAVIAVFELRMMQSNTAGQFSTDLRWFHIPVWVFIVSMVGFVRFHLQAGRMWLGWTVCAVRTVSLLINFLVGQNLNYIEVSRLSHIQFFGASVSVADGVTNPWTLVGQLSLLLLLVFVTDAVITVWRRGDRHQAAVMGGSIVLMALLGIIQAVLVFWGIVHWPITASLFFMGIVAAMACELSREAIRAVQLSYDLQETDARLVLATDAANIGLWSLDLSTNVIWVTPRCREIFGFSQNEEVSVDKMNQMIHPDDRERTNEIFERAARSSETLRTEYRIVLSNGDVKWIVFRGRYRFNLVGRSKHLTGVIIDITDPKQAEEALRASEERYRVMFNRAIDGIALVSVDGEIVSVNESFARMHGYNIEAMLQLTLKDFTTAESFQLVAGRLRRFLAGEAQNFEVQHYHKDGRVFPLEVSASLISVSQVSFIQCFYRDITERKRLEEELRGQLREIERLKQELQKENVLLRTEASLLFEHGDIVGESAAIKAVLDQAEQVARTGSTVLITGETGTGKELLAREIHSWSSRKGQPLITVNCASLPPTLIESELFGREKGAYTGAMTKMSGRFEIADGSSIFLDEIAELPLDLQSKLLRVVEEGTLERLGSTKTIRVNVRIIAATNRDLSQEVQQGRFRQDLFYRLNVFPIRMPPLRERPEDILPLVWSFVRHFEKKMGKQIDRIPQRSMEVLRHYTWPGNVRELKNVIEHAMIVTQGKTLDVRVPKSANVEQNEDSCINLEDVERKHILNVLQSSGWRLAGKGGAAETLGLKRTTLQAKMKKLGIERPTN